MDNVLEWGVSVIASIQSIRTPILDAIFKIISDLGSEYFYFAALPIIITMINRTIGLRIALMILVSVTINSLLKHWIAEPRPFVFDPSVMVIQETGYGFPSGHTQQAALFWGLVALQVRNRWFSLFAAIFVGLIALSRMYLGVHYPTDILGSLVIAGILVASSEVLIEVSARLWRKPRRYFVASVALIVAILASAISPVKDMISATALGAGLIVSLAAVPAFSRLPSSIRTRTLVAGITGVVLLTAYIGLKLVFPRSGEPFYEAFSFVRYCVCGIILGALPIFVSARLEKEAAPKPD